jgi:hypothetical protein
MLPGILCSSCAILPEAEGGLHGHERIAAALSVAAQWGQFDGERCRAWALDQMVRALLSVDDYAAFRAEFEAPDENGDPDIWYEGGPP